MIISDRAILWRIQQAAKDYEDGAIIEARDELVLAVNMIDLTLREEEIDDEEVDTNDMPDSFKRKFMHR